MAENITTVTESQPKSYSLGRTIAKNAAFITFASVALKAVNFIFNVYVVRRLGDARFGQYSTVIAFVGLFQIFAELGVSQYVMREIARDRSKAPGLFWNLVAIRLVLAGVGMGGITLAALVTGYSSELILAIFLYTLTFFLAAFEAPLETLLTANERLDVVSLLGIVNQVVFVILGSAFLLSGMNFIWLIVASLIAMVPQISLAVWSVYRNRLQPFPIGIQPKAWPILVRKGLPFGLISLALTISFSLDTVLLSRFEPSNVVGWYNVAYGLERSLLFFFTGFSVALVPTLSKAYIHDSSAVELWYYRTVKFIMMMSLPVAVGGMLVAYPLIRFLYTSQFLPAARSLQVIIWDVPVLMFMSFCGNMTTVVGEERNAAKIYGAASIVNLVANLYAIPHYSLMGASVVTVLTDLVSSALFYILLSRKLKLPDMGGVILRVVLACALMAGAVLLAPGHRLAVMILVGMAVYSGLIYFLRVLDDSEWASILRLVRRSNTQPVNFDPGQGNG